jgi:hypothetical protein
MGMGWEWDGNGMDERENLGEGKAAPRIWTGSSDGKFWLRLRLRLQPDQST